MIKIGIDAKWYFNGPASGKVVVENLVNHLIMIKDERIDLYLFIDQDYRDIASGIFPEHIHIIYLRARPNLLSNLFLVPYYARKYKLDVVLSQNFSTFLPGSFLKISYIHDFLFLDYPQYYSKTELLYYKPMAYLAKIAGHIITISNSEKERMIKHGIGSDKKISVVYHGLNDNFKVKDAFSPEDTARVRLEFGLPDQYLLYVGRINIRKNLLNLLLSLKFVDDKSIKIVIVGEKEHKNIDITSLIEQENLQHRVIFTGHVAEKDLYVIYANATVFCFPSYAEGFGLPPLESMKSGIPVVVSNRTSLPEVCGEAGSYIDPDDPADIAEKINLLINDPEFYSLKTKLSLEQAQKYQWSSAAEQIIEIIQKIYAVREIN